jgi:hypothetical protein
MSTIVTIAAGDQITNSRSDINTNFSNLNSDKIETSYLDTDTAMAANSDVKIPSQKAVKTYIDTSGGANASTTVRGIVEEATAAEITAGTAAGGTGARLFVNPSHVAETGNDKIVKTKSTGKLDASIIPVPTVASGSTEKDCSATTTTTIAHGLVTAPTLVFIDAKGVTGGAFYAASAVYSASTQSSNYVSADTSSGTGEIAASTFSLKDSVGSGILTGTITIDATNISIAWAGTTFTSTAKLIWFAFK